MTTPPPSHYTRRVPPWAPDLIQRFVPLEELNRQENYPVPPKVERQPDPFT